MKKIMQEYKAMNADFTNKSLEFTFKTGQAIIEDWTVRDLSLVMGCINVNGVNLFTNEQFFYENEK